MLSELSFKVGDELTPDQAGFGATLVEGFYQRRGFLEVDVRTRMDLEGRSARIAYTIIEGPLYRFGSTSVSGLDKLPRRAVTYELEYKEGDPYRRSNLFRTQSNLFLTGYFEDVSVKASTNAAKVATIAIEVKERPLKSIKGGVGWGSEERERFTLVLNHQNFLHRAYRGELRATLSHIWREYEASFLNKHFFGTKTENRLVSNWRRENRDGYNYERARAEASFGRELTHKLMGSMTYRWDRNITYDVNPDIAATTPESADGRSLSLGLNRDTTDDIFMPGRGTRTNLTLQHSGGLFGGTLNFNKVQLDARVYQPVKGMVAAMAIRAGLVDPFSPSEDVAIYDRFFTGGANSVRGYAERGVGPKDSNGDPLGARRLLGGTAELRFPIYRGLRGAAFLDGGQVGDQAKDVRMTNWKYGTGLGLRYVTPVGPFRLDYGYKLNPDADDKDRWRFHFSLGESF